MAFNHYAKIKRIIDEQPDGWFIKMINEPASAKNFSGKTINYDHYYRICTKEGEPIKYCKFQQIELLAKTLQVPVEALPVLEV